MATGNQFLGTARGSVGDVTFYVSNGQQVSRVRRRVIANPRSSIQSAQRVIVKTCAAAYSVMQPLVCQSFQGYGGRSSNQARFLKLNTDALRSSLAAAMDGHGLDPDNILDNDTGSLLGNGSMGACINDYIISDGSLLFPGLSLMDSTWFALTADNASSLPSYSGFCESIGAQPGDQLTFVYCFSNSPDYRGYFTDFQVATIILCPSNGNMSEKMFEGALYEGSNIPVYLPNQRNKGSLGFSSVVDNGVLVGYRVASINGRPIVARDDSSEYWPEAAACILSRRVGKRWVYSKTRLLGSTGSSAPLNDAVASYMQSQSSSRYLDQAQIV